jgi:hypothetical protein
MLFNPIRRTADDDHNNITSGGDFQVIQSNVSLLNYAAKETQDRLLKIERAIFGIDAPTLPGDQLIDNYVKEKLYSYSESLNDMGIIRIIKELFTKKILENTLYNDTGIGQFSGTISYFNDIYLEIFGDYQGKDSWEQNVSGLLINKTGKIHEMYFYLLEKLLWELDNGIKNVFNELNWTGDFISPDTRTFPAFNSARNIYLQKVQFGYQFEKGSVEPFFWPIVNEDDPNWGGPTPEDRWWNSFIMGTTDKSLDSNGGQLGSSQILLENNTIYNYSFSSQSVEGILFDLILKLSYIKNQSNLIDKSLKSDFTFIEKQNIYYHDDLNASSYFDLKLPKNPITATFFIDQYINNNIVGEYTSFGFQNDKIATTWHNDIQPHYLPRNLSNANYDSNILYTYISNRDTEGALKHLYELNKISIKNDLDVLGQEYDENNIKDNVLLYYYNSSGLAFDISGDYTSGDLAADINTKIEANISGIDFTVDAPGKHWYVVAYIGKFMDDFIYEKSDYVPVIRIPSVYRPESVSLPRYNIQPSVSKIELTETKPNLSTITEITSSGTLSVVTDNSFNKANVINSINKREVTISGYKYTLTGGEYDPGEWYAGSYTSSSYTPERIISGYVIGTSGHLIDTLQSSFSGAGEGWTDGYISGWFYLSGLMFIQNSYFSGLQYTSTGSGWYQGNIFYQHNDFYGYSGLFSMTYYSGSFQTSSGVVSGRTSGWASGIIKGMDNSEYISGIYKPEKLEFSFKEYWKVDDYYIQDNLNNKAKAKVRLKKYIINENPLQENGLLSGLLDDNRILISGVSIHNEINGFHLYGHHIPEDYIMLSKVRAQENVADQIHLVSNLGPFNYPKTFFNNNINLTYEVNYINVDKQFIFYWEPLNIVNNYLIYMKITPPVAEGEEPYYYYQKLGKTPYNAFGVRRATDSSPSVGKFLILSNYFLDSTLFDTLDISDLPYISDFIIYETIDIDLTADSSGQESFPDISLLEIFLV